MKQSVSDIVIHIDEDLSDQAIYNIERDLGEIDGVYSACVNERTRHLMVVDYDPFDVESGVLLHQVETHGVHAELIGL